MKYPLLIACEAALTADRFDSIIDVRSPAEFALDHLPGAINLPVLNDQQRIEVGTLYKQTGSFEAKRVGAALIAKNIAQHLDQQLHDKSRSWRPLVYCWRGGNRSAAMAHILAKIGWPVAQLEHGYKAYRQFVISHLPERINQFRWVCLRGPTGSGKSRLLQSLQQQGEQVLDLEGLAQHRGSLLGHLPHGSQPGQKLFESRLLTKLHSFSPGRVVYVESESKKIGKLSLPENLVAAMRRAASIKIEMPKAERVQLLLEDYHHWLEDKPALQNQLNYFIQLVGRQTIANWSELLTQQKIPELVAALIEQHYDPAYQRSNKSLDLINPAHCTLHLANFQPDTLDAAARELRAQTSLSSIICRP